MELNVENEERIRKSWLRIFKIFVCLDCLGILGEAFFSDTADPKISSGETIGFAIFLILVSALRFWILYHCAYRKQGTGWLLFLIILFPILSFVSLVRVQIHDLYDYILKAIDFCIGGFFWYSCLQLYKVNSRRRKVKVVERSAV